MYHCESCGENYDFQPRVSLLSLSVGSYCQNKTIHILYGSLWGSYKARLQNGVSGSTLHGNTVFEPVAHEETKIWTRLSHSFTKGRPTIALRLVEFV